MSRARDVLGIVVAVWMGLAGCGGATPAPELSAIEQLRRKAAAHPDDPDVQRRLAAAELLQADGDPGRARDQIARALELAPDDERVLLLAGVERYVHGSLGESLDRLLATLEAAARSERPRAAAVGEVAVTALEEHLDQVPGFAKQAQARLASIAEHPGRVGPAARHVVNALRIEIAHRRGDADAVERIARAQGCVGEWRVAGPFGPRDLLGFDEEHPAAAPGPLDDEYDLGPGRGRQSTRQVEARGCTAHLGAGPVSASGTSYAEAFVEVPRGGDYAVRLETPNSVELFVDGESVVRLDDRREPTPRITIHPVRLDAGRHELTVKITTRHPNPVLDVSLTTPQGLPPEAGAAEGTPDAEPPDGDGPLDVYLRGAIAMARGDAVGAREALRATDRRGRGSPAVLQLRSSAALADPLRPPEMRRDEARGLARRILERDPEAWFPVLQLARLDAADGRLVPAIERLRKAEPRWPEIAALQLTRAQLLMQRGWEAEAADAVAKAREQLPDACPPIQAALELARRRDRASEVRELTDALVQCDARSQARLTDLVRQRRWDRAEREIERLAKLTPRQNRAEILTQKLHVARGRDDGQALDELLAELEQWQPKSNGIPLAQADRKLAAGKDDAAIEELTEAIERDPASMAPLRWARQAIGGEGLLDRWRLEGLEELERFEASGREYDAPSVLVLDSTVIRVFEDGSALELTHNIWKLRTEEAIDQRGEYQPPDGARMLTLRTIKRDGRRIEPERIEGKDSISLPELTPGDYVEYEYARMLDPPRGFPDGSVGDRFYFRSFETPFDRSELTLVAPEQMEVTVDPRGEAPATQESRTDGLRVMQWKVRESRPLQREPMSIPAREWVPSVNWGVNASWNVFAEGLLDVLADRNVRDPAAVRLTRRIAGDAWGADPTETARRLYAWVLDNVDNSNDAFGQAAAMLTERTGNRARVMHYMLGLAGIPSKLVLARDVATDQTRSELADDETYKHLLVMLAGRRDGGPRFLSMSQTGAPFGYVPPGMRGQDALVLERGAPRVQIPAGEAGQDRRDIEIDLEVAPDGSARARVVETFRGAGAISWRQQLEGVAEAMLEQRFDEQYVARLVPGARLTELQIEGRDSLAEPLVFRYGFEVPSVGRREGPKLLVPPLFPDELARTYARTGTRRVGQLLMPPKDVVLELRLRAGSGVQLPEPPPDVSLRSDSGARFEMTASRTDGTLRLRRALEVPITRVSPSAYPQFARFCRRADQAITQELTLLLPRGAG